MVYRITFPAPFLTVITIGCDLNRADLFPTDGRPVTGTCDRDGYVWADVTDWLAAGRIVADTLPGIRVSVAPAPAPVCIISEW